MCNDVEKAKKLAEAELGFEIPPVIADYILGYTVRKFLRIISKEEKPEGYFGVLYQNEIMDYFVRKSINDLTKTIKEAEYVLNMQTIQLP